MSIMWHPARPGPHTSRMCSPMSQTEPANDQIEAARKSARKKIMPPALILILIGTYGVVMAMLSPFTGDLSSYIGKQLNEVEFGESTSMIMDYLLIALDVDSQEHLYGNLPLVLAFFSLAVSSVMLYGGIRMLQFKDRSYALGAAIMALFPLFNPVCCLSFPFGLWVLYLMAQPDIKAQFK